MKNLGFRYTLLSVLIFFATASLAQAQSIDFTMNGSKTPGPIQYDGILTFNWVTAGVASCEPIGDNVPMYGQVVGTFWRDKQIGTEGTEFVDLTSIPNQSINQSITAGIECFDGQGVSLGTSQTTIIVEPVPSANVTISFNVSPQTVDYDTQITFSGTKSGTGSIDYCEPTGIDLPYQTGGTSWRSGSTALQLPFSYTMLARHSSLESGGTATAGIRCYRSGNVVGQDEAQFTVAAKEASTPTPPPPPPPPPATIQNPEDSSTTDSPPADIISPTPPATVTTQEDEKPKETRAIFSLGDKVKTLDIVNVRTEPSTSNSTIIRAQLKGAEGVVIAGPEKKNDITWWKIDFVKTPDGWVSQDWIVKIISTREVIQEAQSEELVIEITSEPAEEEEIIITETILKERASRPSDSDSDGISDYDEVYLYGTDPNSDDTDGDGIKDEEELLNGIDPRNPSFLIKESGIVYFDPRTRGEEKPELFSVDEVIPGPVPVDTFEPSSYTFRGMGPPNTLITIYIFSTPIIVTVKTNSEGVWEYTLERELENGDHEMYVAITDAGGEIIAKSSPVPFVKEAQAIELGAIGKNLGLPQKEEPGFFNITTLALLAVGILAVLGIILVILGRKRREDPSSGMNIPNFPGQ